MIPHNTAPLVTSGRTPPPGSPGEALDGVRQGREAPDRHPVLPAARAARLAPDLSAPHDSHEAFLAEALATVMADLDAGGEDMPCAPFLVAAFTARYTTAKEVAVLLGIEPGTLESRFHRAGLHYPKRYLVGTRLIAVARLLENPHVSIEDAANALQYSSAAAFHRHMRYALGMSVRQFRAAYTGAAMLERFRAELICPYREVLRTFDPMPRRRGDAKCPKPHEAR